MRTIRLLAVLTAVALAVAACGQHPEVDIADAEMTATGAVDEEGEPVDDAGVVDDDLAAADPEDADPGESAPGADPGEATGPDDDATGAAATDTADQEGEREVRGSDRTGVTDDTITLGLHAPVTGAAPLPSTSFEESGDLWWRWVTEEQGRDVLGRDNVELIFRDDRYDPSAAIQVCRELAERAFHLTGGGGTDQIQACGEFADRANVPYFSAGVTERGLRGLDWYFAASMSYRQQGPLLAQYVANTFPGERAAMVVTDTENFDDAVEGWMAGVERQGIDYHDTLRHPRGDSGWYRSFAAELRDNDVDVVYVLTAPVDYIRFAQQAHEIGYEPQWVGVGITKGLNPVLGSGCPEVDGGIFFSPFPGLDWARENEREFFQAVERFDAVDDDLSLAIWGSAKSAHAMFERYGEMYGHDLTREDFRSAVEQMTGMSTGVFPDLDYSPDDHFGADQVHVIQADCDLGEHVTLESFATGF